MSVQTKYSLEEIKAFLESGEPIFILRGKDTFTVPTIIEYAFQIEQHGHEEMAEKVRDIGHRFALWQGQNETKYPDQI